MREAVTQLLISAVTLVSAGILMGDAILRLVDLKINVVAAGLLGGLALVFGIVTLVALRGSP